MKSFFAGKRSDSKQTSMQATHMQAHPDSNKANNETSTDQNADRCMQHSLSALQLCVTATADHRYLGLQRSTCDLLDAWPGALRDHDHDDDRPRSFHWPQTQTLDYHCRHSMAILGDESQTQSASISSWLSELFANGRSSWPAISDIWLGIRTVPVLSVAKLGKESRGASQIAHWPRSARTQAG